VLAVQVSRHGGPEELVLAERPDPVAGAGQVVVCNEWIGVNYVDLRHRAGQPYPVGLPLVPGTERPGP
jgi:NADPH2:quinone reductase